LDQILLCLVDSEQLITESKCLLLIPHCVDYDSLLWKCLSRQHCSTVGRTSSRSRADRELPCHLRSPLFGHWDCSLGSLGHDGDCVQRRERLQVYNTRLQLQLLTGLIEWDAIVVWLD